jgi:hypothetical protein
MSAQSNSHEAVPISDPDDSPLSFVNNVGDKDADLHGSFTLKEKQISVFGAAVQIYNSRRHETSHEGITQSVEDAATIFTIVTNEETFCSTIARITEKLNHR